MEQPQVVLRRTLGLPLTEGDLRALFKRLDKVIRLLRNTRVGSQKTCFGRGKIPDGSFETI